MDAVWSFMVNQLGVPNELVAVVLGVPLGLVLAATSRFVCRKVFPENIPPRPSWVEPHGTTQYVYLAWQKDARLVHGGYHCRIHIKTHVIEKAEYPETENVPADDWIEASLFDKAVIWGTMHAKVHPPMTEQPPSTYSLLQKYGRGDTLSLTRQWWDYTHGVHIHDPTGKTQDSCFRAWATEHGLQVTT